MPVLAWFSRPDATTSSDTHTQDNTPLLVPVDDLIKKIHDDQTALQFTTQCSDNQIARIQELEAVLSKHQQDLKRAYVEISKLHKQVNQDQEMISDLQNVRTSSATKISNFKQQQTKRNKDLHNALQSLKIAAAEKEQLLIEKIDVASALEIARDTINEIRLENEMLKCSQSLPTVKDTVTEVKSNSSSRSSNFQRTLGIFDPLFARHGPESVREANRDFDISEEDIRPLPPVPFIAVLVDGDSYFWLPDHYTTENTTAGAHAAQCVKEEIQKYIVAHQDRIPIHVKVIVRVICNLGSGRPSYPRNTFGKRPGRRRPGVTRSEFMVQFCESMPLFDYFDAGNGKERVDEKIKENFHVFVSNPQCHAVFLACCTDNGFARLLEQYSNHPVARSKIVLVHPGYVIDEIAKLNLNSVEWPRVFVRLIMPEGNRKKILRDEEAQRKMENQKRQAHVEGEAKYGKEQWASMLVQRWAAMRVNELTSAQNFDAKFKSNIGVRLGQSNVDVRQELDSDDDYEDLFYHIDTGVD